MRMLFIYLITSFSLLFIACITLKSVWHINFVPSNNKFGRNTDFFRDLGDNIPDSRLRISKLDGVSLLGRISMWLAFPTSDSIVPGTSWYETVWEKHNLGGTQFVDEMISLSPCKQYDKSFVQIGAHLGVFPLVAAYRECHGIAVEGMPLASNFTRISAKLNGWNDDQFTAINAAVSNRDHSFVWFNPGTISISMDKTDKKGQVLVPLITLDSLNNRYQNVNYLGRLRPIAFVIIDVEGHEQEVLLSGSKLIKERSVLVFQIEVWTSHTKTGIVSSFPGLQLLVDSDYRLYTTMANTNMNFASCDECTHRLGELHDIFNGTCYKSPYLNGNCLGEIVAVRSDLPSPRIWSTLCSR